MTPPPRDAPESRSRIGSLFRLYAFYVWLIASIAVILANFVFFGRFGSPDQFAHGAARSPGELILEWSMTGCAWVLAPLMASGIGLFIWRRATRPRNKYGFGRVTDLLAAGFTAGLLAGGTGWFIATLLICIGHRANGQTPLAALIMSVLGAGLNGMCGTGLAGLWLALGLDRFSDGVSDLSV